MVFHCRLKQIIVWLTRCTWIRANWSLQKQFTWLLLRWEKPSWQAPYCTTVSQKRRNCLTTQTYGLCSNGRGSNLLWTSLIATPATALCTAYRKYCLVKKKSFLKSVLTWSQSRKTFCPFSFSNENHMWTPIPTSYDRGSYPRTDYLMCVKSLFVLYITG